MESHEERKQRILNELRVKYPNKTTFDMEGKGLHFVCEVEPTSEHPEYDKAIEVIIESDPHKHLAMTQHYTILRGDLTVYVENKVIHLKKGDVYTIAPGLVHWATSDNECWLEIHSMPGWTAEDHIKVVLEK